MNIQIYKPITVESMGKGWDDPKEAAQRFGEYLKQKVPPLLRTLSAFDEPVMVDFAYEVILESGGPFYTEVLVLDSGDDEGNKAFILNWLLLKLDYLWNQFCQDSTASSGKSELENLTEARANRLPADFLEEVNKLVKSGGFDTERDSVSLLFGVALENLADNFLRGYKGTKQYKNLRRF